MSALNELAARCEAAEGPDRELDCLIYYGSQGVETSWVNNELTALIPDEPKACLVGWIDPGKTQRNFSAATSAELRVPHYTASLDAAMQLVDGDTFFHISRFDGDHAPMRGEAHVYPNRFVGDDYKGEAATPALALCAAALKARAAQVDTHPQGGDAKQAPGESLSSAVGAADAPETPGPTPPTKEHTQ